MTDRELLCAAEKAESFSYCPYSGFRVGAALLTKSGKLYSGCNIENASFGLTNCAERTALFKAVSEGERDFAALAISSKAEDFCLPCGACLQALSEFTGPDFRIILKNSKGEIKSINTKALLPFAFELPEK